MSPTPSLAPTLSATNLPGLFAGPHDDRTAPIPVGVNENASVLGDQAPASARLVFELLRRIRFGVLDVRWPHGTFTRFGTPDTPATDWPIPQERAQLHLHDWSVCAAVLSKGDIGFAEAYRQGLWDSPDLAALLRLFLHNRQALETAIYGNWWSGLIHRIRHALNRNTRKGSRHNIAAHYDLGNRFYSLWLDETMNYSSAWFQGRQEQPLEQAQWAKVRRALQACQLQPGQRVLEIGCGWGAVAECAVREFDASVVGLTLSVEQHRWATERMAATPERADIRLQDYRDVSDGPFDAIVSIEMFEAVGQSYWPAYFQTLARQLKRGGLACVQTITIHDELFDRYVKSTDFIQQYIFPGGLLPSPLQFRRAAQAAGLRVVDEIAFGTDYAHTLRHWRNRFMQHAAAIREQGFDEGFMRLWPFYLAYCEAAFDTGSTDVMQFTLAHA
jgi:cyclopropane-fatty-acyl-phospholipid synthase